MGNMSYCRFRNTVSDLRDCQEALCEIMNLEDIGDEDEQRAARRLVKICREIADDWGEDA